MLVEAAPVQSTELHAELNTFTLIPLPAGVVVTPLTFNTTGWPAVAVKLSIANCPTVLRFSVIGVFGDNAAVTAVEVVVVKLIVCAGFGVIWNVYIPVCGRLYC